MALSIVDTGSASQIVDASGTSAYQTSAQNVSAGNLLVVGVSMYAQTANNITSLQDTAGNSYTIVPGGTKFPAGLPGIGIALYYAKNCLGNAANKVQVNFTANQIYSSVFVWQVAGADTTAPFDAVGTGFNASGSPVATSAFSTLTANDIICMLGAGSTGADTFAPSTGFTPADSASIAPVLTTGAAHAIVSSVQTNITPGFSDSGAGGLYMGVVAAAFKAKAAVIPVSSGGIGSLGLGVGLGPQGKWEMF